MRAPVLFALFFIACVAVARAYEADDSDDDKRRPMPPFLDKLQKIQRFFTKDEDGKRLAKIGGEIKLLILRLRKRARNALRAYLKRLIDEE